MLTDEEYRSFQNTLVENPESGSIIKGSGGLRKIRWKSHGKGKRGGLRIIYFFIKPEQTIFLIYVYDKSKQTDLSKNQLRLLENIVKEEIQ